MEALVRYYALGLLPEVHFRGSRQAVCSLLLVPFAFICLDQPLFRLLKGGGGCVRVFGRSRRKVCVCVCVCVSSIHCLV